MIATIILFFALIYLRRDAGNSIGEIAKAILGDEFVPYYQPIVDIQTGRLLGAEVLVRWRRADGSLDRAERLRSRLIEVERAGAGTHPLADAARA